MNVANEGGDDVAVADNGYNNNDNNNNDGWSAIDWRELFVEHVFIPLTANTFARVVISLLDNAKISQQLAYQPGASLFDNLLSLETPMKALRRDGLWFLVKGNGSALWRLNLASIVDAPLRLISSYTLKRMGIPQMNFCIHLFVSTLETIVFHPIDMAKNRLTVQPWGSYYHGTINTIYQVCKEEGWRALWNGWQPAVSACVVQECLKLAVLVAARKLQIGQPSPIPPEEPEQENLSWFDMARTSFTASWFPAVANLFAQTFSIPFDLVKKRRQVQSITFPEGQDFTYSKSDSALHVLDTIVHEEGATALGRGILANHAKALVAPFLTLFWKRSIKNKLLRGLDARQRFEMALKGTLAVLAVPFVTDFVLYAIAR